MQDCYREMKAAGYILALVLACATHLRAQTTTELLATGLPLLQIQTVGGELPTADFVFAPEGCNGISLTNVTRVPGRLTLQQADRMLYNSGEYKEGESGMTIKMRGNTSAYFWAKKPYKIKLEKRGDLLSRGSAAFLDKHWVLLADGDDGLNTHLGFLVNDLFHLGRWTPQYLYVNVIINDRYEGIYMLIEQVRLNENCRLAVDEREGYIFECDSYWWNTDTYFSTPQGKYFTFKHPDEDEVTPRQTEHIWQAMCHVEESIITQQYTRTIDLPSWASWLLAHDILGTSDSGGSNIFLTKNDQKDTSPVTMATLWDFGSIMRTKDSWSSIHIDQRFFYYPSLLNNDCTDFRQAYIAKWEEIKNTHGIEWLIEQLDAFALSDEAASLERARVYNRKLYPYSGLTVAQDIGTLKAWLYDRQQWLTHAMDILTPARAPHADDAPAAPHYYDLTGRPATGRSRLVVQPGGKKKLR